MTLILQNTTFIDASTEVPALGTNARLYDRSGTGQALFSGVPNYNDANTGDLGVGSFKLIDNRDNKPYLVRRLADGNCWMVQNLDLNLADFAGTHNLTVANTDLNSDVAQTRGYYDPQEKLMTSTLISGNTVAERLQSAYGFAQTAQFQSGQERNSDVEPQYAWASTKQGSSDTPIASPTSLDTIVYNSEYTSFARSYDNIAYSYVLTNPTTGASTTIISGGTNYNLVARSITDGLDSYKDTEWTAAHASSYVGDYYNWYATTAESGTYWMDSGNAEDSICSLGWQLPIASDASGAKSFYNLIALAYAQNTGNGNPTGASSTTSQMLVNIGKAPISLVKSGYYATSNANLNNRGNEYVYWLSTVGSIGKAHRLGQTYMHDYVNMAMGAAIRCVSRDPDSGAQLASTCPSGSICYNGNGGTGSMANQTPTLTPNDDTDVVLTASTFTRLGYGFAGWNTQKNGFGTTYGPNETITIADGQLEDEGLQLYAKWIPSTGTMQDFTTQQCTNLGIHQSIALTDSRDGNTYTVTKLKDNNCWMTQNLALNLADFAGTHNLTPANTDLNSTTAVNRGYWDPAASTVTKYTTTYKSALESRNLMKDFNGLSTLLLGQAQPAQFQSIDQTGYWWGSKVSTDGNYTLLDVSTDGQMDNVNAEIPRSIYDGNNSYGVHYNWYAATAESGTFAMTSGNATDSICPKGWGLPSGTGSTKSWRNLFIESYHLHANNGDGSDGAKSITDSEKVVRSYPLSFVRGGDLLTKDGTIASQGRTGGGDYWSSTPVSQTNVAYLAFWGGFLHTPRTDYPNKAGGMNIRCVKK